jgi:integrase/recombinase XerC
MSRETAMNRRSKVPPSFAALVQAWFAEYLTQQRALSAHTIAAYRDSFVLFLEFTEARVGKSPAMMTLADMTPELITGFLDHLERQRHNCVRSRNARLSALRSFLKFAAHRDVASLHVIDSSLPLPIGSLGGLRPATSHNQRLGIIGHCRRSHILACTSAMRY